MSTLRADAVAAYLKTKLGDADAIAVSNVARIPGGASRETWSFDASWREGGVDVQRSFILRRDPTGSLLETDRDVEFRIYEAMAKADVPVPPVYWLEPEGANLDRPFFVMGRMPGQSNPNFLASASFAGSKEEIARQKASILARIHRADWRALNCETFLEAPPTIETAAATEVGRWERIMSADALEPQPVLELAFRWLRRNLTVAPAITVVHADYRTGNFLYESDRITAVLDWEMVHLGDPMEDLGWLCGKSWRYGTDFAGGLVPRETFFEMYEAAGGFPVDRESVFFYEVLGNVKLAVIFLTGGKSFVEGTTSDLILAMTTRMIPGLEAELLDLLEGKLAPE